MKMKSRLFKSGVLLMFISIISFIGCEKSPVDNITQEPNANDEALSEIIASEGDVLDQTSLDDDGEQSIIYDTENATDGESLNTVRFGRRGEFLLDSIEYEYFGEEGQPDTLAIATITRTFKGEFIIAEKDTTDAPEDYRIYKKDMENTLVRKTKLVRRMNTGNPRLDWKLDQVSMGIGYSDPTTINISEVKIVGPDGQEYIATSPLDYYMDKVGLPTFSRRDTVKVYVSLSNTNNYEPAPGTTVLLHWGVGHRIKRARRPFNDEGIYPDEVAGDGVFSGYWVVQRRPGKYHAAIDAIDNGTIYDATAPYNAVGWGTPYRVKF